MKIEIELKKDLVKLQKKLGSLKAKQLPYATAKALNELALESRPIIQDKFKEDLEIRNKGLLRKSIQVNWANKNDWPFSQSEIGITDEFDFLAQHSYGTMRLAKSSIGRAIPVSIKRASSGKIASAKRPKALLAKKAFLITAKSGKKLIVQRESKARYPIKVLYALTNRAEIKNKVEFNSKIEAMFSSRFDLVLGKQLSLAISNMK